MRCGGVWPIWGLSPHVGLPNDGEKRIAGGRVERTRGSPSKRGWLMRKKRAVAIDGPAAAGKSTVARILAEKLGYTYIDTGAMYRAVTLKALRLGVDCEDGEMLGELARTSRISFSVDPHGRQRVWLDDQEVTEAIREPEVSAHVSQVAAVPQVRRWLAAKQRAMAERGAVVVEGRDITTHVLPDAEVKVYLDARFEERVRRRWLELKAKGHQLSWESVAEEISMRDKLDSERAVAPLRVAEDALRIDTTQLRPEQVVELVLQECQRRLGKWCTG